MHISNLLFLGFNFGCAYAPTAADLIGFRVLGMPSAYAQLLRRALNLDL